jgi:mono/diheme cytochrome c family protein
MRRFKEALHFLILAILSSGFAVSRAAKGSIRLSLSSDSASGTPKLYETRQSPSDLEVGGELVDLPPGSTRFITRDQLLALPQVSFTVTGDSNFTGPTKIEGVELGELISRIGASAKSDLAVAICDDKYRANYPRAYLVAHHPVLVLKVNGKPPAGWPKDSEEHKYDMGPYMISHPKFTPSFKILTHQDEPQIPWGVVRLEFRNEKTVFGAIAPAGPHARDADVQAGFRIAQQNCFRCHNAGGEGGQKSGYTWQALSGTAIASPEIFMSYIRNPLAQNPQAQMPGNKDYDNATLHALVAYFHSFSAQAKP